MIRLMIIILLFCPTMLLGQFYYPMNTGPDSTYLVSEVTTSTSLGQNIAINQVDESFTIAGWINLNDYSCDGFLLGTDQVKITLTDTLDYKRKKVRFSIKDSLVIEGQTFIDRESDLLEPAPLNQHIAVTYNGNNTVSGITIYINGDAITAETITSLALSGPIPSQGLKIGSDTCDLSYYKIESYDRALNSSQIATLSGKLNATISESPDVLIQGDEKNQPNGFLSQAFGKFLFGSDTSRTCFSGIWGGRKGSDAGSSYGSPIESSISRPQVYYSQSDSTTYIATQSRPGPGFNRNAYVLEFDHRTRILTMTQRAKAISPLTRDNHQTPAIIPTKDNFLLLTLEDRHNSPMYVYKDGKNNRGNMNQTTTIGTNTAYPQLFYLHDSLYMICRKGNSYANQMIFKSTNNGNSWDSGNTISTVNAGDWNYSSTVVDGDSIVYHLGNIRDQTGASNFRYTYVLQSRDGRNFCSMDSSLCKDVTTAAWTQSEIFSHAILDSVSTTTNTVTNPDALVDTMGRLHIMVFNDERGDYVHATYNSGWVFDTLSFLPNLELGRAGNTAIIVYKGGDSFDLFHPEDRGNGFETVIKYTTNDNFQTFNSGQIVGNPDRNYKAGTATRIQKEGQRVIVAFTEIIDPDTGQTGLWIYEYNPWNQGQL